MKELAILFLGACVLTTFTHAQAPAAAYASNPTLQVETTKSIDAKKVKAGDEVTAVLTQDVLKKGKIVLPRGSKVKGHISEAQPRTKENPESKLGLVFDKVIAKGGAETECGCTIAAVAPPMEHELTAYQSGNMGVPQTVSQPRNTRANVRAKGGAVVATPTGYATLPGPESLPNSNAGNSQGHGGQTGALSSGNSGVIGIDGLHLISTDAKGERVSVLSSNKETVKLESGTQLVLLVSEQAKR